MLYPDNFPAEVVLELSDERYASRTHGKKPTYQAGCRGPLCRKIERDTRRVWYAAKRKAEGRDVRPRERNVLGNLIPDEILDEAQVWHERDRASERAG